MLKPRPEITIIYVLSLAILMSCTAYYYPYMLSPRYDYDTLLLRDLAARLNPITGPDDRLLLYEIQGQYHLTAHCISLDGIVGGETLAALQGREQWPDCIRRAGVRYVCTMNAFTYRQAFKDTLLEVLYWHDLVSPVGSTVEIEGIRFKKLLTNPDFADPGRYEVAEYRGDRIRVYGAGKPGWAGETVTWNSVYERMR